MFDRGRRFAIVVTVVLCTATGEANRYTVAKIAELESIAAACKARTEKGADQAFALKEKCAQKDQEIASLKAKGRARLGERVSSTCHMSKVKYSHVAVPGMGIRAGFQKSLQGLSLKNEPGDATYNRFITWGHSMGAKMWKGQGWVEHAAKQALGILSYPGTAHKCSAAFGQCYWSSLEAAKQNCAAWPQCKALYCSTEYYGGAYMCFARSGTAFVHHPRATSYARTGDYWADWNSCCKSRIDFAIWACTSKPGTNYSGPQVKVAHHTGPEIDYEFTLEHSGCPARSVPWCKGWAGTYSAYVSSQLNFLAAVTDQNINVGTFDHDWAKYIRL